MARRFEAPHRSFALSRWLMRVFCPIIQAFVLSMFHAPQDLTLCCPIAGKFIGDDHTRHVLAAFEEFTEELLGCGFVAAALDQDI